MKKTAAKTPRSLLIFGATGSIGQNTLDIISRFPKRFSVTALSVQRKVKELLPLITKYKPQAIAIADDEAARKSRSLLPKNLKVFTGAAGLVEMAEMKADMMVNGLVGASGLPPTMKALETGKDLALANKETLVVGGELVLNAALKNNKKILPVDSEHAAIFNLLRSWDRKEVAAIILTASGGPFRTKSYEEMARATRKEALKHPTWKMGAKITIDSSTLMNKGFEVIEAHYLFRQPYDGIKVIIHPQSLIHSMVETKDGEVYAQLGPNDMRYPILNALAYPEILENDLPRKKLWEQPPMFFEEPDVEKFPLLKTAYDCGRKSSTYPAVLNATNEIVVAAFLEDRIRYFDIYGTIRAVLKMVKPPPKLNLDELLKADTWARKKAHQHIAMLEEKYIREKAS